MSIKETVYEQNIYEQLDEPLLELSLVDRWPLNNSKFPLRKGIKIYEYATPY